MVLDHTHDAVWNLDNHLTHEGVVVRQKCFLFCSGFCLLWFAFLVCQSCVVTVCQTITNELLSVMYCNRAQLFEIMSLPYVSCENPDGNTIDMMHC